MGDARPRARRCRCRKGRDRTQSRLPGRRQSSPDRRSRGRLSLKYCVRAQEVASFFDLPLMIHMCLDRNASLEAGRPSEAGRHRDTHVRAAAQRHHRRQRTDLPRRNRCPVPRRVVRRRQWANRASPMGYVPPCHASGILARHHLDRRQRDKLRRCERYRLPERHVQVAELQNDDRQRRLACASLNASRAYPQFRRPRIAQRWRTGK